jgi:hypothetical protein
MGQRRLEVALVSVLVGAAGCSPPDSQEPSVAPHSPIIIRESHNSSTSSTNWSGYAVTASSGSVTDVKGSWSVPAIVGTCPATNQYSSFWVGIDGFNSGSVEQIGTDSDCQNGAPSYYAWFEFYPHPSYLITGLTISPGDVIDAETSYSTQTRNFTVKLTNVTTGGTFSTSARVSRAQRSSAEWIAEAPSSGGILPLADFGTSAFGFDNTADVGTCDATIGGGAAAPIGSFGANVQEITMVTSSGAVKAQPSGLTTDGTSFTDTWVSAGP